MATETADDWAAISARMGAVPQALADYRAHPAPRGRPRPRQPAPSDARGGRPDPRLDRPVRQRGERVRPAGRPGQPDVPATLESDLREARGRGERRRTPSSRRSWSRTSPRADATRRRSAASSTRATPATSSAPRSTSTRPTRGAGRSCTASRPRCSRSRRRSPVHGATIADAVAAHREPTPRGASTARRQFREWMQEPRRPDPRRAWPTRTSTSPSRSGGSSAGSRRPRTAASTTRRPRRTSPGRAGCGGRSPTASRRSTRGAR